MRGLAFAILMLSAGVVRGQFASPPPVSGRASSGTPLSEIFTSDSLFPKKTDVPPVPLPPPVIDAGEGPDGGLFAPLPPPRKIWFGSADVGLNGAMGNSDLLNLRGGWNVRRKTDDNAFTSDFQYVFSKQSGTTKTDQFLFNARDEILFGESRWSAFTASQLEYDEFRAYRFRVGAYAGAAFRVIDDSDLSFKLRAGAGATRELGTAGARDRWVPEFLFGYDFRARINNRSTLVSILDVYPQINDIRQFRARARVAYEYILDPALGAIYRIGIQDRYDSDPGNAKRNDVTYFTTLGVKF